MSEKKFRAGLVGAGHISEFHVQPLQRLPFVEIVGVHDLDRARAEALGSKYGIPVMASLAALRAAGADVIHVLTPPHTHAAVAAEALRAGCHVLVEKPLATDAEDCVRLAELAKNLRLEVGVSHSLLFDPQVRAALEAVRGGALGDVISVDILRSSIYPPYPGGPLPPQYRTAGYPFRDLGIHGLYVLEAFLGPIEKVDAEWQAGAGDSNLVFNDWRALVKCQRGMGQIQLAFGVRPLQHQIILQGTKGVMRLDLFLMFQARRSSMPLPKPAERIVNALTDSIQPLIDVPRNVVAFARKQLRQYHGVQELVTAFYQALADGTRPPVTAEDAIRVVRFTEEVARAADRDAEERARKFPLSARIPYLVTGASGGLGSALLQRLRAEHQPVRVMVRRLPERPQEGVEYVRGDLADPAAVDRAVQGVRCVFHVGAAMKGGWPEHQGGTVEGTRNVLAACRKHGVEKLVHVSSLSVIDWAGGDALAPVDEDTPFEPRAEERGAYTRAKLEAEKLVAAEAAAGLPAVIIRPGQIFGGRIPLMTGAIARRAGGRYVVLGDGEMLLPLVFIDDVVDALVLASKSTLHSGEVIQIVDPDPWTQNRVLAEVAGSSARVLRVPRPAVFAIGRASELALGLLGKKSPVAPYRLRSALALRTFQSQRAEKLLGWKPRVGVQEGIRRSAGAPAASS
ncbi:MAG TPA: NAD-dependent epimerase/dehydratase family protein [Polyangia bacterium]|nr:NAD-dependent epimerase/dehydratase family protein [Polyangia bacterium]